MMTGEPDLLLACARYSLTVAGPPALDPTPAPIMMVVM